MKHFNSKSGDIRNKNNLTTFTVPYSLMEINEKIYIKLIDEKKSSKYEIINSAIKFHLEGNIAEAKKLYEFCLDKNFADQRVFSNYGMIMRNLGEFKDAAYYFQKAIELDPKFAQAYSNLGNILNELGQSSQAIEKLKKAIDLQPDLAEAYCNLGVVFKDLQELKRSEIYLHKAIQLRPDYNIAHWNLSQIFLKQKKFKEGWEKYSYRWKLKKQIKDMGGKLITNKPEWNSTRRGKVLLWQEQGLGDTFLFSSIIPDFLPKVDKLIIAIDKRLIPIYKRSLNENISIINRTGLIDQTIFDFHISMGTLPRYLRKSLHSFQTPNKFKLKASEEKSKYLRTQIKSTYYRKIVGISWKSKNKGLTLDLSLEKLILGIFSPDIRFVCLQYGDVEEEVNHLREKHKIEIYKSDEINLFSDIDGLAALITACDEVVSIDNLTPFLASSLGIKSNVLLPINSRWQYGEDDQNSYWYESIKYFRQNKNADLDTLLKKIKEEIKIKN